MGPWEKLLLDHGVGDIPRPGVPIAQRGERRLLGAIRRDLAPAFIAGFVMMREVRAALVLRHGRKLA